MGRINMLRQATQKLTNDVSAISQNDTNNISVNNGKKIKKRTKLFTIEAESDDYDELMLAIFELSNRDKVFYKKKDIYIAMVKYFLELVKKDIKNVKIERH